MLPDLQRLRLCGDRGVERIYEQHRDLAVNIEKQKSKALDKGDYELFDVLADALIFMIEFLPDDEWQKMKKEVMI